MHREDLLVNDSGNRQAVEAVGKRLPQLDVVPSFALVVEAVNAIDRGALVVPAQDEEVLGILDLVCEEQADGLERLLATVYVVAEEQIVRFGWETAILEQAEQIIVLAVDITANLVSCEKRLFGHKGWRRLRRGKTWTDLYRRLKLEQDRL